MSICKVKIKLFLPRSLGKLWLDRAEVFRKSPFWIERISNTRNQKISYASVIFQVLSKFESFKIWSDWILAVLRQELCHKFDLYEELWTSLAFKADWGSWNSNQSNMENSWKIANTPQPVDLSVVSSVLCSLSEDRKLRITICKWFAWTELKNYSISLRSTLSLSLSYESCNWRVVRDLQWKNFALQVMSASSDRRRTWRGCRPMANSIGQFGKAL